MTTATVAAFLFGAMTALTAFLVSDRRALAREEAWWEELRAQALDGYGRVFDWQEDLP